MAQAALAEQETERDVWQPMSTAPRVGPILLRSRWAGRPVALVGAFMPVHGSWCTQDFFGQGAQIIHADGWTEIPNLRRLLMTDTLATVATPPQQTASPFHQPARDNAGNELPPLQAHTQKPDAPAAAPQAQTTPAPRRGVIDDSAYHGLPPDQQSKYAMVRRPGDLGGSEWVARAELESDPAAAAPTQQGEKFRLGQYEISEAELSSMMERQAAEDLRRATIPATPEAHETKLPADFKAPAGIEYKFDPADPSLVAARNWAHAKGLSQDDFSQLLSLHAAHVSGQEAVLQERARAEIAKAGINAPQRVDAVGRWITAEVGEADAKPIRATIVTDAHLRFYERILSKLTSQGSAAFSQQHRDHGPQNGRVGEAEYSAMSDAQRLDYARQFDQKQFNSGR